MAALLAKFLKVAGHYRRHTRRSEEQAVERIRKTDPNKLLNDGSTVRILSHQDFCQLFIRVASNFSLVSGSAV